MRWLIGGVVAGCAPAEGEPGPGEFDPDYATSDVFFTLMSGPAESETVHGTMQIWYSSNLRDLVTDGGSFTAPVGSVAIKHQVNADGTELTNTMVKLEAGELPDGLDWRWEQRSAEGEVTVSGAVALCVGCHDDFPDQDYLAGTGIR